MRTPRLVLSLSLLLATFSQQARAEDILNAGDSAPALKVAEWVKGTKVEKFEPGKIYVVEFWATWCGPCIAAMPHVTELAHKYKDKGVTFIGVDVWENDLTKVKPFIEKMGDKIGYNLVLDSIPAGGKANDGAMATTWLKAAEENGIPSSFIIKDGKIAWIGHPMDMDKPLAEVVDGKWDHAVFAKTRLTQKLVQQKTSKVQSVVYPLLNKKDYKEVVKAINEMTSGDADLAKQFASIKFLALCNGGDIEAGLTFGAALLKDLNDDGSALNNAFWNVIDPKQVEKPDPRIISLALKALKRSVELTGDKNYAVLDSLALAQSLSGDSAAAAETEEKAVKALKAAIEGKEIPLIKELSDRAETYRKAAKK